MAARKQNERTKSTKILAELPNKISTSLSPSEIAPGEIPVRLKEDIRRWKMEAE